MLLETYTTLSVEELKQRLPEFLNIGAEVTGDPAFSMFNLSLKEEWVNNKKFCHRLSDDDGQGSTELTKQAKDRLDANKSRQSSPTSNGSAAEKLAAVDENNDDESDDKIFALK